MRGATIYQQEDKGIYTTSSNVRSDPRTRLCKVHSYQLLSLRIIPGNLFQQYPSKLPSTHTPSTISYRSALIRINMYHLHPLQVKDLHYDQPFRPLYTSDFFECERILNNSCYVHPRISD